MIQHDALRLSYFPYFCVFPSLDSAFDELFSFTLIGESMSVGYIDTSGGCRAAGEGGGVDEVGHMVAHCSLDSKHSLQPNQTSAPLRLSRALPRLHSGVLLPVKRL